MTEEGHDYVSSPAFENLIRQQATDFGWLKGYHEDMRMRRYNEYIETASEPTFLQSAGYELLDIRAGSSGKRENLGPEPVADIKDLENFYPLGTTNFYDFKKAWSSLTREQKLDQIPDRDYRKSLVEDPDVIPNWRHKGDKGLRIMHPDFENQLLYNAVPEFNDAAWARWTSDNAHMRSLRPPRVTIAQSYGDAKLSRAMFMLILRSLAGQKMSGGPADVEFYEMEVDFSPASEQEGEEDLADHEAEPVASTESWPSSIMTLGQGFWSCEERYVGEAIFAMKVSTGLYVQSNEAAGNWESMMGVVPSWNDTDGRHDTYLRGDQQVSEHGRQAYGILMPAQSARTFSVDKFRLLQQQWYNNHVDYLTDSFTEIIKKRVEEAFDKTKDLKIMLRNRLIFFGLLVKNMIMRRRPGRPSK